MQARNLSYQLISQDPENQILRCLEEGEFEGNISLLYTRRPRALDSLKREGEALRVYGCFREKQLWGFGAAAVNPCWIHGEIRKVAYLFSFRIHPNGVEALMKLPLGLAMHFREMENLKVNHSFTTILEENLPARRLLEKRRKTMPIYQFQGRINSISRRTGSPPRLPRGWRFSPLVPQEWEELLEFYAEQGSTMDYFPVLTRQDLAKGERSPRGENFYLLRDPRGKIMAAGAAWDQRSYKQYIPMGYQGVFKYLRGISSWLFPLFGYPALPRKGKVMDFFLLSFWAVRDQNPRWFRHFIHQMKGTCPWASFFSLALHESHPLYLEASRGPVISYVSRFYQVLPQGGSPIQGKRPLYVEPGRL